MYPIENAFRGFCPRFPWRLFLVFSRGCRYWKKPSMYLYAHIWHQISKSYRKRQFYWTSNTNDDKYQVHPTNAGRLRYYIIFYEKKVMKHVSCEFNRSVDTNFSSYVIWGIKKQQLSDGERIEGAFLIGDCFSSKISKSWKIVWRHGGVLSQLVNLNCNIIWIKKSGKSGR